MKVKIQVEISQRYEITVDAINTREAEHLVRKMDLNWLKTVGSALTDRPTNTDIMVLNVETIESKP